MKPPEKGFRSDQHTRPDIDLGLIQEMKVSVLKRPGQFLFQGFPATEALFHRQFVKMNPVFSPVFRAIHRNVRMADEIIDAGVVTGIKCDPPAGRQADGVPFDFIGLSNLFQKAVHDGRQFFQTREIGKQDQKFVAAHPTHGVAGPNGSGHSPGDFHQQKVAHVMSGKIVHVFEPVEVQKENAQSLPCPARLTEGVFQTVPEKDPVGKPGQGIVIRQKGNSLFGFLDPRQIMKNADMVFNAAVFVLPGTDRKPLRIDFPGFSPVPKFPLPVPVGQ